MPDTPRSLTDLLALFADNTSGNISAQDMRDALVSVLQTILEMEVSGTGKDGGGHGPALEITGGDGTSSDTEDRGQTVLSLQGGLHAQSVLDVRGVDNPNPVRYLQRWFPAGDINANPHIDAGGGLYTNRWISISGTTSGTGDNFQVVGPTGESSMFSVWSDLDTHAVVIRNSSAPNSYPMAFLSTSAVQMSRVNAVGEYENETSGGGVILKSPAGNRYRLTVADDGSVVSTDITVVDSVAVTPTSAAVEDGLTTALVFRTYNGDGNEITGRTVTVVSADPAIASVSPASGASPLTVTVTGEAVGGPVNVTGTSEGESAAAAIRVTAVGVIASDSFNRADQAGLGTADVGGAWANNSNAAGLLSILSNRARISAGASIAYAWLSTAAADCEVGVTLATFGNEHGLVARYLDDSNYLLYIPISTTSVLLRRYNAGASTNIGTAAGLVLNNGTAVLSLRMNGSAVEAYVDGVLVISGTDAGNATNTKHGIGRLSSGTADWDDFYVQAL